MFDTLSRFWRELTRAMRAARPTRAGPGEWTSPAPVSSPPSTPVPARPARILAPAGMPDPRRRWWPPTEQVLKIHDGTWTGRDLPGDLRVPHDLIITSISRLRAIGDGLAVPGDLKIGGCHAVLSGFSRERKRVPIRALPNGLRVGGSLELRHCFRLERLPDDLSVGGSIVLEDCDALAALPDPLHVRGSLRIVGGRSLAALPSSLRVDGDFFLAGTRVTALPAGLTVGGSLVVEGRSRLTSIPADLRVGDDIALRRCPIESLPDGLHVSATLRVIGARKLKRLPEGLTVPGKLDLSDCSALVELPRGLTVGHSLKLRRCTALTSLPHGLTVPYTLDLRGCTSLAYLPRGMTVGATLHKRAEGLRWRSGRPVGAPGMNPWTPALRLADCPNLTQLPDDLDLGGLLEVAGSGLRDLPPSLGHARVLWRGVPVDPDVVFHPERIAPLDVLGQANAELRRVMMEQVGAEAVLAGVKAETRDADTDAGGPRRLVFVGRLNHCYLVCRCPSTARQYLLRVPPGTRTCRQAAAWMAGYDDPDRYRPLVET